MSEGKEWRGGRALADKNQSHDSTIPGQRDGVGTGTRYTYAENSAWLIDWAFGERTHCAFFCLLLVWH